MEIEREVSFTFDIRCEAGFTLDGPNSSQPVLDSQIFH
jgi:hypothetical protein